MGLKAATVTPEGADDVGSPNRILREELDGRVTTRTGRRIPGVTPVAGAPPHRRGPDTGFTDAVIERVRAAAGR